MKGAVHGYLAGFAGSSSMMKFYVFKYCGFCWIFDDSERTYICSTRPTIWAVPVFNLDEQNDQNLPEPDYFSEDMIEFEAAKKLIFQFRIEKNSDEKEQEKYAWKQARILTKRESSIEIFNSLKKE